MLDVQCRVMVISPYVFVISSTPFALLDLAADNVLGDIVLLAESESLSDLASPLGTESARLLVIGEASNLAGTLLENLEGKDAKVGAGDAASDGLTLALTSSSGAVGLDSCNK